MAQPWKDRHEGCKKVIIPNAVSPAMIAPQVSMGNGCSRVARALVNNARPKSVRPSSTSGSDHAIGANIIVANTAPVPNSSSRYPKPFGVARVATNPELPAMLPM